jgi:hypothetical protein
MGDQSVKEMGHAGLNLVSAIFYNARRAAGDPEKVLALAEQTRRLVVEAPLTRQYEMAAASQASAAHLILAENSEGEAEHQSHLCYTLEASEIALDIYQSFGFVQIIECSSEEVHFRHYQALLANSRPEEAAGSLRKAHDEMMRKYNLIPEGHVFRGSYLENIPLHRQISAAQHLLAKEIRQ